MNNYGQHRRKDNITSKLAVVVVGEASESEEEDDDYVDAGEQEQEDIDHRTGTTIKTIDGKYVDGPAAADKQASNSKSSLPHRISNSAVAPNRRTEEDNSHIKSADQNGQSRRTSTISSLSGNKILIDSSSSLAGGNSGFSRASKESLLHSLLKESNSNLKHNLIHLSCTPYATASKDIGRITRHLIASQRSLQSSCGQLHKTANEIHQLNRSFNTLSTYTSINNKLLQ